jgi:hypothetical protein
VTLNGLHAQILESDGRRGSFPVRLFQNAATIIKQGPGFNINGVKVGGAAAPAKATTTVKAAASSSKQQTSGSAAAVKHTKK